MFKKYQELLTIGIPVYNEEKYIKQTIESCIDQAGKVMVSDNASTDNTQNICTELAKKYSNLVYIRQEKNIGGTENFNFVLKEAKTKYFMWLGAHDYLDENYTTHMIHVLENYNASGCYPAARAIDIDGNEIGISDCWFTGRLVSDSALERVYNVMAHLHEVIQLFGIYHTSLAQKFKLKPMIGNDHEFVCEMARCGRLIQSPRSIYNWRQTKIELSASENVAAWQKSLGNDQLKISASRKEMRDIQINILKKCKCKNIFEYFTKLKLISKARKKLLKRFGY